MNTGFNERVGGVREAGKEREGIREHGCLYKNTAKLLRWKWDRPQHSTKGPHGCISGFNPFRADATRACFYPSSIKLPKLTYNQSEI